MRLVLPPEMKKMRDKIDPYLVAEGLNIRLREDTPEEIVELYTTYLNKWKKLYDEVEQDIMG